MMNTKKKVVALDSDSEKKKQGSLPQDMKENKRCCSDCKTTQTPLWRGGPAGPKSLCNACGIRYRKKGIPIVSLGKGGGAKRKRQNACGIRYRRNKGIPVVSLSNGAKRKREKRYGSSTSTITTSSTTRTSASATTTTTTTAKSTFGSAGRDVTESLKVKFVALSNKVLLRGSPSSMVKKQRYQRSGRELGEAEQAAVCLLALSCDSVFG